MAHNSSNRLQVPSRRTVIKHIKQSAEEMDEEISLRLDEY